MVFVQPTTYALINITDFPFFVAPLNEIEHVHFERVFSSSKTCDLKIIMKVNIGDDHSGGAHIGRLDARPCEESSPNLRWKNVPLFSTY